MEHRLWPKLSRIQDFANKIELRHFHSGQVRLAKDPPAEIVLRAFEELGTHRAVAAAFGVSRRVVTRWILLYGLEVVSRPEIRHGNFVARCLEKKTDRIRVAQWVVDEGSVGATYVRQTDHTALLVCGSMNDFGALSVISSILRTPCTCSRSGRTATLPLLGIRVISAKAYALLGYILPHMKGLKAMEAQAALTYFPPSGILLGRHTTDEFLVPVWKEFATSSLKTWNAKRRQRRPTSELERLANEWVEGRIKRARRFVDTPNLSTIQ